MTELSDAVIRVVFDNNVLLQAMSNANGPAGICFQRVRERRIRLCLSRALLAEFADVAYRPILIRKLRLTDLGTSQFLAEIETLGEMIEPVPAVFEHPVDPKDSMVVNLAIAARAHVITSRDHHLPSLRDAATPTGAEFMSKFGFIQVLTPIELLDRVPTK